MRAVTPSEGGSQHANSHQPHTTLVFVSAPVLRRVWFALVLTHVTCTTFVGSVGVLYVYMLHWGVADSLELYGAIINVRFLPQVAAMYFTLASIHVCLLWDIILRSFRSRVSIAGSSSPSSRLVQSKTFAHTKATQLLTRLTDAALERCQVALPARVLSVFSSTWRFLMACRKAMDVRHHNYGLFFLVRELVQSSLQTYQAYRLSCLVPRVWMNNVIVVLLVLNCWSTPLLQYVFPTHTGKLRLGCALVSISLDFVSQTVIPIVLLAPYARQFDYLNGDFPTKYWYIDVWFIQTINEFQLLFVTSFWDALSKFMVATSVARWLYVIAKLVRVAPLAPVPGFPGVRSVVSVVPSDSPHCSHQPPSLHQPTVWKTRVERIGKRMLIVWGCVILIAHLYANSGSVHPQCLLRTRPWFGSKPSCSLLSYDCLLENSTGSEQDLDTFLQRFNQARIEYLVFRRCPALEMPSRVQTLSELRGLKLYRSTIRKWDSQAALTNSRHPEMLFVFLVDVNMSELPQGLQSADFPKKLSDIEVYGSNVSSLHDDLASIWPTDMFLILENCQFQQVPNVVPLLNAGFLSLALNNISNVSTNLLGSVAATLFLDGNPIQTLPANLTGHPPVHSISFRGTQLSSLPDWIDEQYLAGVMVLAGGTPLCDRMIQMGKASASAQLALFGIRGLDCSSGLRANNGRLGWYPINVEELNDPMYSLEW